ncbi:KY peptidase, partial [Atractosteus spatula]|nr:KY peptidase [Atractosteus spatula]
MALHSRLSVTQRVLLAVLCFPLLPFYLCYLCCCATEEDANEQEEHRLERMEQGKQNAVEGSCNVGFAEAGKYQQAEVFTGSTIQVEIHPINRTQRLSKKLSFGKARKETRENNTIYDNKGFVDDTIKTQNSKEKTNYAYPWDRSNLKSFPVDLGKFKQLDAYSSKVKAKSNVEVLVQEVVKQAHSELEKVRAIWMWVTHNIEYDVEGFHNPGLRCGAAEEVLRTGKGVCGGYASLFQKMCSLAGIKCVEVSGYSKGYGYQQGMHFTGQSDHAWNAVVLEEKWHLLDSTWGAGKCNDDCSKFTFQYDEFYFLTHPALFVGNHFPLERKWQLLEPPLSLRQFENALDKKSCFYNLGLLSILPESPQIQAGREGKATVMIESSSPVQFMHTLNEKQEDGILTLRPDGMKLEIYPQQSGKHSLKIYAKNHDAGKKYSFVCEYQLQCKSVNKEMRLPAGFSNPVGPSWLTESKGLHRPTQCGPLIHTQDGRCSFGFSVEKDLSITSDLITAAFRMTDDEKRRHIFVSRNGDWVEFKIQLPRAGLYVFSIYAKKTSAPGNSYGFVCNYLISCTDSSVQWPVFPLAYASWMEEYELVEPLVGVLPANRDVHFKLKIPKVAAVSVSGTDTHKLTQDVDGYWTGTCSTRGCKDLNVMIQEKHNDRSYSFVLNYQVKND